MFVLYRLRAVLTGMGALQIVNNNNNDDNDDNDVQVRSPTTPPAMNKMMAILVNI